jgi:hypothetical protein
VTDSVTKPLSHQEAARLLDVCERTLENWCDDGLMPSPGYLGNSRYWHPDVWNDWLDATLLPPDVISARFGLGSTDHS